MLECPRWSATLIKLHGGFAGVALRRGCSPVDLVVFFGARFNDSTSGGLLLHTEYLLIYIYIYIYIYILYFPSTHLTHEMCVLRHQHFIYFSTFSELDDNTPSLLQALFSLNCSINFYNYVYMYTLICIYCIHIYLFICMHACVFVFECVCIYIF